MPDKIINDAQSLRLARTPATTKGEPVSYDGAGGFETTEPGPGLLLPFVRGNVAASTTAGTAALVYGTSAVLEYTMPVAFRLLGFQIAAPAALTGGSLTARIRRNGTEVASLGIASGSKHSGSWLGWRAAPQFAAGDIMTVVYDTDAAFAPSQNIMLNSFIAARP